MKWYLLASVALFAACSGSESGETMEVDGSQNAAPNEIVQPNTNVPFSRAYFVGNWSHITTMIIANGDTTINPHNTTVFYSFHEDGNAVVAGFGEDNKWEVDETARTLTMSVKNPMGEVNVMTYNTSIETDSRFLLIRKVDGSQYTYFFDRS